jgi:hypothetical protein
VGRTCRYADDDWHQPALPARHHDHPVPGPHAFLLIAVVAGHLIAIACVSSPPVAHRGAGITAPTKTQAAVPDETLAHA